MIVTWIIFIFLIWSIKILNLVKKIVCTLKYLKVYYCTLLKCIDKLKFLKLKILKLVINTKNFKFKIFILLKN